MCKLQKPSCHLTQLCHLCQGCFAEVCRALRMSDAIGDGTRRILRTAERMEEQVGRKRARLDNVTIAGLTFHQQYVLPRQHGLPFAGLYAAIDAELDARRYVISVLREQNGGPQIRGTRRCDQNRGCGDQSRTKLQKPSPSDLHRTLLPLVTAVNPDAHPTLARGKSSVVASPI
jgi:hypothetical protein